jgi:hypothetical protein
MRSWPATKREARKRRGFVVPQPQERPRCSCVRFGAELPNRCWQAGTTHWALADGTDVEVLNFLDDHSRLLVPCAAGLVTRGTDVVDDFVAATGALGLAASVLTDNGAIFTAEPRKGRCAMETSSTVPGRGLQARPALPPPTPGPGAAAHRRARCAGRRRPGRAHRPLHHRPRPGLPAPPESTSVRYVLRQLSGMSRDTTVGGGGGDGNRTHEPLACHLPPNREVWLGQWCLAWSRRPYGTPVRGLVRVSEGGSAAFGLQRR